MKLSPKAFRLVADAVRLLPDYRARNVWRGWEEAPHRGELVGPPATVAIRALEHLQLKIRERLEYGRPTEDAESELKNDLAYTYAILGDLQKEATAAEAAH
ncbi:MAG TPA: hypothetical protein VN802_06175 [Stellaceae bacterium]|nr:hypothetical protein [Stellaceae bacterium]